MAKTTKKKKNLNRKAKVAKKKPKKIKKAKKIKKPATKKKVRKSNGKKMSAKDKKYYRGLLLERKQDMLDEIRNLAEGAKISPKDASGDISAYTLHMADVATDAYDREFSLTLVANDRKAIQQIDEALKRMEEGKFGICQSCGCKITKARLKALPQAWMCVKCQQEHEAKV